ncbi:MAG: hypothetical protein JXB40_03340 [Candidatus Omnitrophica bacterium]|nr:hypothetical protein [Candidatus Omnitrophota bacterium]
MIEINLLPQELRKKPSPFAGIKFAELDIKSIPIFPIAVGIGAVAILLHIGLFIAGMNLNSKLISISKKYDSLIPMKKEADALSAMVADINKKSAAIDDLMAKRFSWAKKLNALSDSMAPGIWLSELYYDERPATGKGKKEMPGALMISGYAAGAGEQGAASIGRFIKMLQDDESFYSDFEKIDLVSTKSDRVDNQDVMSFRIMCYFK